MKTPPDASESRPGHPSAPARRWLDVLVCAALVVLFVQPIAWILWSTGRSIGEMLMLSPDDLAYASFVSDEIARGSFGSKTYLYPHFYFNVVKWPLLVAKFFTPVTDWVLIAGLRLASVVPALVLICGAYWWVARRMSRPAGIVAALTIALSPAMVELASTIHPDCMQLLFIGLGLALSIQFANGDGGCWHLLGAFACAGIAFATKYHGATVVVAPLFACWWRVRTGELGEKGAWVSWPAIRVGLLAGGVAAVAGAAFFSPEAVSKYIIESGKLLPPSGVHLLAQLRMLAGIAGGLVLSIGLLWNAGPLVQLRRSKWAPLLRWTATGAVVALAAAIVASPSSFVRLGFLKGLGGMVMILRTHDIRGGVGVEEALGSGVPPARFLTLEHFLHEVPPAASLLAAVALVSWGAARTLRHSRLGLGMSIAALVTACFLGSLLASGLSGGKIILSHYVLPTLPGMAYLAAAGFHILTGGFALGSQWQIPRWLSTAATAVVAALFLWRCGEVRAAANARVARLQELIPVARHLDALSRQVLQDPQRRLLAPFESPIRHPRATYFSEYYPAREKLSTFSLIVVNVGERDTYVRAGTWEESLALAKANPMSQVIQWAEFREAYETYRELESHPSFRVIEDHPFPGRHFRVYAHSAYRP